MGVVLIAAADEIRKQRRAAINDYRNRLRQADRADRAGTCAGYAKDFRFVGEHRFTRQLIQRRRLDLVDFVVATNA